MIDPGPRWTGSYPQESAAGAICWNDRFRNAIAAKTNRDLLLRVAELVYRQTSPDGASTKIAPPHRASPAESLAFAPGIKHCLWRPSDRGIVYSTATDAYFSCAARR
jgi:hypothetical protein